MQSWDRNLLLNTSTCNFCFYLEIVWKELEKENKEFFEAYTKRRAEKASEAETSQKIHEILLDSSKKDTNDDA
ncbi:hypothetical protein BUALT_Bualt09G0064900 [Buddleja alternifolia]|uniref:Uncharacterized protein n=1 Tax=Buddleja alternifolia TaxID=168488 RepID=A0AAV6X1P5_9LAMI|nr:hypothetical protein BUALT_Bualt09G0064900 [Buddleja alternifolia]